MGIIEPIVKSILLVLSILIGTWYFAKKTNRIEDNATIYVQNHLLHLKGYKSVGYSSVSDLNSHSGNKSDNLFLISRIQLTERVNKIRYLIHYYRLSDTLYSVRILINEKDSIIFMDVPAKERY